MNIQKFKRGTRKKLASNFSVREFECKCGICPETLIDLDHVEKLQKLRDQLGKSIKITSAYRCSKHNKNVGGSPNSQHVKGTATDITVKGIDPCDLADMCEHFDGLGRYNTFTHIDSRGTKARWDVRSEQKKKSREVRNSTAVKESRKRTEYLHNGPSDIEINLSLEEIEREVFKKRK
jgi:hypothetical protein